jgi:hypothetical protein
MATNRSTSNSLLLLLWNANGIQQRRTELEIFLHEQRIDIALITETHLTQNSTFYIPNYNCYCTHHPNGTARGGTALLIRSTLSHTPRPSFQTPKIQATVISLHCNVFDLTLASVYCPPSQVMNTDEFTQFFNSLGHKYIAGGDFNAKNQLWGARANNPKGISLWQTVQQSRLTVLSPNSPTYWPSSVFRHPDLLDIFIARGISPLDTHCESFADLSSDHSPVLLTLSVVPLPRQYPPSLTAGIMDWNRFRELVSLNTDLSVKLKSIEELETAVDQFTRNVQQASWNSCTPYQNRSNNSPNYPAHIRLLIQERRRARRRWQQARLPTLKNYFNNINNKLKRAIQQFNNNAFEKKIAGLSSRSGSLWSETRRLLRTKIIRQPLMTNDGTWTKNDKEQADLFATCLADTFKPHAGDGDAVHDSHVSDIISAPLPVSFPFGSVSPNHVRHIINHLPLKKSPGFDLITAEVLKELPDKGILFLTYIFNCMLRLSHFPLQWKASEIIMILKPGKPASHPSSYRPISLLPVCSKVFEKILLNKIVNILPAHTMFPNHQFGFRPSHSTVQQLHRVSDFISSNLELKRYSAGIFLDVSNAFDRVWHDGLNFKLRLLLPAPCFLLMKSFLTDRFFRIRCNASFSNFYPVQAGVPQGAVLSPALYNIYTADLPLSDEVLTATYADDIAILASSILREDVSQKLQNHLLKISRWCTRWKIKLNSLKSQMATFSLRPGRCPPVFLNDEEIIHTDSVRYLGLSIDRRQTWSTHIKKKRKSLDVRLKQLYRLIGRHSSLPIRHKLTLYNYFLKPIWLYGAQIYGSSKPSNMLKIQRFQNKVLRMITKCPRYVSNLTLHTDLQIPFVMSQVKQLYRRFFDKLDGHENPLVQALHSPHLPNNPPRRLRRQWSRDLRI